MRGVGYDQLLPTFFVTTGNFIVALTVNARNTSRTCHPGLFLGTILRAGEFPMVLYFAEPTVDLTYDLTHLDLLSLSTTGG